MPYFGRAFCWWISSGCCKGGPQKPACPFGSLSTSERGPFPSWVDARRQRQHNKPCLAFFFSGDCLRGVSAALAAHLGGRLLTQPARGFCFSNVLQTWVWVKVEGPQIFRAPLFWPITDSFKDKPRGQPPFQSSQNGCQKPKCLWTSGGHEFPHAHQRLPSESPCPRKRRVSQGASLVYGQLIVHNNHCLANNPSLWTVYVDHGSVLVGTSICHMPPEVIFLCRGTSSGYG